MAAHEIAQKARSINLPEDDIIIVRAQEIWWAEENNLIMNKEPESTPENSTEYYSDTIRVLVTKETKQRVEDKLSTLTNEATMIAQIIYNEARGIPHTSHKAAVAWCILNRVDDARHLNSISGVVTQRYQFAYSSGTTVDNDLVNLSKDVLTRWLLEKEGFTDVGRVLPYNFCYFGGNGKTNTFRTEYSTSSLKWDWTWGSPY